MNLNIITLRYKRQRYLLISISINMSISINESQRRTGEFPTRSSSLCGSLRRTPKWICPKILVRILLLLIFFGLEVFSLFYLFVPLLNNNVSQGACNPRKSTTIFLRPFVPLFHCTRSGKLLELYHHCCPLAVEHINTWGCPYNNVITFLGPR